MLKLLVLLVLSLTFERIKTTNAIRQEVKIFDRPHCEGESVSIHESMNLGGEKGKWGKRAVSTRLVGMWLFFGGKNYNGQEDVQMEYIFSPTLTFCYNFKSRDPYVMSLHFVGALDDLTKDSIMVFSKTHFQTTHQHITKMAPNFKNLIPPEVKSLIVTGTRKSGWTLFSKPDFKGDGICIYPPDRKDNEPLIIQDTNRVGLQIGSIKYGCRKDDIIYPSGRGSRLPNGSGFHGVYPGKNVTKPG